MSAYIPPHKRASGAAQGQSTPATKDQSTAAKSSKDLFDECYCINLARRSDRLRKYEASARRAGLRWTRFEAVDGAAINYPTGDFDARWDATRNAEHDRHVAPGPRRATAGEKGCALSHVALWRKAIETEGWLLITEDDCRFDKRWLPGPIAYLWREHVPSDAELVYLGFSDRGDREYVEGTGERVFRSAYGFCTHCYAIRGAVAQRFLDALPVAGPVDVWLVDNNWFGAKVYCAIEPGGGWQNTGRWLATQETKPGEADVRQSSRDAVVDEPDAVEALAGAAEALHVTDGTPTGGTPPPAMAPGETLLVNGEQMSYERLLEEFGDPARTIGREVLAGCPQNSSHPWVQGCISCGCMSKATRYAVRVDERWDCVGCYVNGFIHMKRGLAPGEPIKPAP